MLAAGPDTIELIGRRHLVEPLRRPRGGEPGEEARQRPAVADVRGAHTAEFDAVLTGFGQNAGVGATLNLGARILQALEYEGCGGHGICEHARLFRAQLVERRGEILHPRKRDCIAKVRGRFRRHLAGIDEQLDRGVGAEQGKAKRHRAVFEVAAAHIEKPGDRIRESEDGGIDTVRRERLGQTFALGRGAFARELGCVQHHGRERRVGAVLPDGVDRVGIAGPECPARFFAGLADAFGAARRLQPWIISEDAVPKVFRYPVRGRLVG